MNDQSVLLLVAAAYFLPTVIAMARGHLSAAAIFAVNLLFGWLILGWVVALVWSLTGNTRKNHPRLALTPSEKEDAEYEKKREELLRAGYRWPLFGPETRRKREPCPYGDGY